MEKTRIAADADGNRVAVIPEIIFANKQNIDWGGVEEYLRQHCGGSVEIEETKETVYIGKDFPDEYAGSRYTRSLKGARAKAKANAAQGIREMAAIASGRRYQENRKEKHSSDAGKGWYYYTARFALPVYDNGRKTGCFNTYTACMVVNHASNGRMYLYDVVDIKKEASNPLKTIK